ncbi:glycosyltransferase [Francisella hispaniensis]|uniref:glycosyltransferase n=1 Tax=Francisella hispaniensis TaxID=622488 RepID=UPI0002EA69D0|nr:glycosyltransferase [Francisella hispaniensis]
MKKILLYGDFSNYNVNLSKGLRELGYSVDVASTGDGFKKTVADITVNWAVYWDIKGQIRLLKQFKNFLKEYELIQVIAPYSLPVVLQIYLSISNIFFRKKYKIFSSIVGCDYVFWTTGRKVLGISLFDEVEKYGEGSINRIRDKLRSFLTRSFVRGYMGMPEYYYSYIADAKYRNKPIALTLAAANMKHKYDDLDFDKFTKKQKLVFFHGIPKGREGFKGSHHIKAAFEIAKKKYKDIAEFIIVTSVPYDEYIEIVSKTDIVFDQTNFHIYGMATLEAMEAGKIVASCSQDKGFWSKVSKDLSLEFIPKIYTLKPDKDFILSQIDKIIQEKQELPNIAKHNRKFVEKYHNPKLIAQRHLDFWKNNMVKK